MELRLDPGGTLDLGKVLILELHLRMSERLDLGLRGLLNLGPLLKLDSDLGVDLGLCLGLQTLDLLDLAKRLDLDRSGCGFGLEAVVELG